MNHSRMRGFLPIAALLLALTTGACSDDREELMRCQAQLRDAETRLEEVDRFRELLVVAYATTVRPEIAEDIEALSLKDLFVAHNMALIEPMDGLRRDLTESYLREVGLEEGKERESMSLRELHRGYRDAVRKTRVRLQEELMAQVEVASDAVRQVRERDFEIRKLKGRIEDLEIELKSLR